MQTARFFILISLLVLIETFLIPLPLVFVALFLSYSFYRKEETLFLAFFTGLVFDSFFLRPFGTTPLLFLLPLFVASLYRRKFEATNLIFLTITIFVSILILEYTYSKTFVPGSAIFGVVVSMLFIKFFLSRWQKYESWYRVS